MAAAGNVELTWDPVPNNASYFVRLNGVWLATVNGTSYTHAGGNIADDYSIRVWLAGTPVDISCTQ